MKILPVFAAMLLAGTALPAFAQETSQAPAEQATETTPEDAAPEIASLPWGVTLNIPQGWTVDQGENRLILTPPEGDVNFAIIKVLDAENGGDAIATAWKTYDPEFDRTVRLVQDRPARDGWEESVGVSYETSPAEKLVLFGSAQRFGDTWTVILGRGALATVAKRNAQLGQSLGSMRPASYERETFAGKQAHALDEHRIETIKKFVRQAMDDLEIPGVGLALIDDGKIVYEGGLGTRLLGAEHPVGKDTPFFIASNTKGMATLLLSSLVDEGKLRWDDKVVDVYPQFRLGSDETTASVAIEHLVCACTGLPRKDMQLIFNTSRDTPASNTFDQLAATEPTSSFGEVFQYNNLMASAAGYVAGSLINPGMEVGAAFDKAMQDRIFDPLGMANSGFGIDAFQSLDYAEPHSWGASGDVELAPVEWNHIFDPFRPAGGAYSTAHDMALYVQNELAEGGERFGAENLVLRRMPKIPTGEDSWYGMGLQGNDEYGVDVFSHGGSLLGYKSNIWFIPEAGVGAVLLTNSDSGQSLLGPFARRLLEVLYDGKPEAAENVASSVSRGKEARAKERADLSIPGDPDVVGGLAARYVNGDLGPITIDTASRLTVTSGEFDYVTRANEDGTHSIVIATPGLFGFPMVVGEQDGKRALFLLDSQHQFVFLEE